MKHAGQAWPSTPALAAILLGGGLMLLVLTPPFQAPDEPNHLLRAYQVSEGGIVSPKNADGMRGGMLPEPLIDAALTGFASLRARSDVHTSLSEWRQILDAAERGPWLDTASRRFIVFPNSARYSPVPYVPAAVTLAIGRVIGANAYALLYAARLANLLTAMVLTAAALAALADDPRARLALFAFAGTPMCLFLAAACSADAVTNGLAFFVVAVSLRLSRRWNEDLFVLLLIAAALLSLCKGVYLLLPLAALPAVVARWREVRDARALWARIGSLLIASIVPALLWSRLLGPGAIRVRSDFQVGPIEFLTARALPGLRAIASDLLAFGLRYISEMIGVLGWLDTDLPIPMRLLYALSILLLSIIGVRAQETLLVEERERAPLLKPFVASIGVATALLVYGIALASWTKPGGEKVYGIQGRYFIPAVPPVLLTMPLVMQLRAREFGSVTVAFLGVWLLTMVVTAYTLLSRYWGL